MFVICYVKSHLFLKTIGLNSLLQSYNDDVGIFLSPTYKMYYVNMQHYRFFMQLLYVNMQHNFVDMQHILDNMVTIILHVYII